MNVYNFLFFIIGVGLLVAFFLYYSKRNIIQNEKQPKQQSLDKYFDTNKNIIKTTNNNSISETSFHNIEQTDLKYLKNVSQDQMHKIITEEIYSIKNLREKIRSKKEIEDFSERIGAYKKLVNEWINLGEFSKLTGITQEYIDIFATVNIKSLEDLSKQTPEKLYELLKHEKTIDPNSIPTIGMLSHWIRITKKIDQDKHKINLQSIIS